MASTLERNIQVELYRILQNLVAKKFSFNDVEFVGVRFEPTIDATPDLVVEAVDKGKKLSLLVIETDVNRAGYPLIYAPQLGHFSSVTLTRVLQ